LELWLFNYYYVGGVILANIKSAKKRILVAAKKTERNKAIKSKVKTMIKKVDSAVAAGDKELAKANLVVAVSEIDKACQKGIIHKNTAARKVSRLTQKVNKLA
jgi:small subunit ribosomal protein S20